MMKIHIHTLRYYQMSKPQCRLIADLVHESIKHGYEITIFTAKNNQSCRSLYGEKIVYINNFGRLLGQPFLKILDYISFNIQSTIKSAFLHLRNGCDIDIYLSGTGFISPIVMTATKLFRFNSVFWILDRYPDIFFKNKVLKGQFLFNLLKRLEIFFQNRINHIIFETNVDMKDYYKNNGTAKATLIRTWGHDINQIKYKQPELWEKHELANKDVMVYSGNFGYSQPIQEVLDFFKKNTDKILFLLGDGSQKESVSKYLLKNRMENIFFNNFLPDEEYAYVLKNSKYGIISLRHDIEGFSSKMTTYLSYDLPILAFIGNNNDMAEIINEYHCGIIIDNKSNKFPQIITSGSEYDKLRNNANKAKEVFNKKTHVNKFIKTLESIARVDKSDK